ncbi:MAG: zinc ribbon domain-containing protein [Candidatus Binatus sp.]|jgi:uncharacterized OB-fold protein
MSQNFMVPAWIHLLDDGRLRLIGQRCRSCGTHAFPRTTACKKCSSTDLEQAMLGPNATLYSVTTDRTSTSAANHKLVGQAQFPDGAYVQGYVAGDVNYPPRIGAPVELVPYELRFPDGQTGTTYGFRVREKANA